MTTRQTDRQFESTLEEILRTTWEFYPNQASRLGLHEYDGRLPDLSKSALDRRSQDLRTGLKELSKIEVRALTKQNQLDHSLITARLQKELFELTELKIQETNPMGMLWHIELSNYVKREYAPLKQRVEALVSALEAVPSFIADLTTQLAVRLSKPVLEVSIEAYGGIATFYRDSLPKAVDGLDDRGLAKRFTEAQGKALAAVNDFGSHLKSLQAEAVDDFAIGRRNFQQLLRYGEMVDLPLERLLKVGMEDLARNRARFERVAAEIDPRRRPREVMDEIARDHPTAESLIDETQDMLEGIRHFLVERHLVTVPSEVRCQATETPAFMRWATAAMDLPGPFETRATDAYYYVTPVEDHWSDEEKEEWLTVFNYPALQSVSIHEAYPGHYVHYLHARGAPSKISQIFGAYSFSEGWAHYAEEMMMEEGYAKGDPRIMLGQLSDALLRNCRYVCGIQMHTEGMSVEEATRYFMENAYMEELPARKEAMRGTFDPMYLNYMLGKLMILKLREDYRAETGSAFSLRGFHDAFLSFGAPPIPLLRQAMLREPGTDVL